MLDLLACLYFIQSPAILSPHEFYTNIFFGREQKRDGEKKVSPSPSSASHLSSLKLRKQNQ